MNVVTCAHVVFVWAHAKQTHVFTCLGVGQAMHIRPPQQAIAKMLLVHAHTHAGFTTANGYVAVLSGPSSRISTALEARLLCS